MPSAGVNDFIVLSGAPSSPNQPSRVVSNPSQSKRTASLDPSSSAGASSIPSSSGPGISQKPPKMASGSSQAVSTIRAPGPPQQEISEKVLDAFDDLELGNISPQQTLYSTQQHPSRTGSFHSPVLSSGREHSRGRQQERNANEREWDEKRGVGVACGDASQASGPSNMRPPLSPQQSRSGTIQAPIRSTSLTSASFALPQVEFPRASSFIPPPPYTTPPSFSSSALPSYPSNYAPYSMSVRRMLLIERIRPWLPFIAYGATIVGFALAIGFWKEEVFGALDELAQWLRSKEETGYAVMFLMIFLTCIPPVPLYSTLQVLSGYTFGVWTGSIVSYFSALAGAIFVFWLSRSIPSLRCAITSCMSRSRALQRVVRAISKRPSLLFLVRLAPYPYNVLNALLAGCPRLTFRTYTYCTALSLLKVIIHTSIGAGIKNFAEYHSPTNTDGSKLVDESGEDSTDSLGQMSTIIGIVLCVVIAVYLTYVARRAVDEELEDDDDMECPRGRSRSRARVQYGVRADDEESAGFLDEPHCDGLGPDFAAFASASTRGANRESTLENGEMVERHDTARLGNSSPAPLSSLSATPYGPPEWADA
ncbi:hypothetical protein ACEPAF_6886 [Sanghuangporus sanghuang]